MTLTEAGMEKIETLLRDAGQLKGESLYDVENVSVVHHINQALRAHTLFTRDKDYIVRDDEVVIIDEFTGRMMPGRRYSEGLHQALEAKEHVAGPAGEPDARLDHLPELFPPVREARRHDRHGADRSRRVRSTSTSSRSWRSRPTCRSRRLDEDDEVYRTAEGEIRGHPRRDRARQCAAAAGAGRHRLDREIGSAGRVSEEARLQADRFRQARTRCEKLYAAARAGKPAKLFAVLNARFHEQEAYIVAEAGVPGAITIATNMAGRGTDIKLGGSLEMRIQQETAGIADEAEKASEDRADQGRRRALPRDRAEGRGDRRDRAGQGRQAGQDRDEARRPLHHRLRAPRIRAASTTSCAAVPAVRAIPAARNSSCRWKTI